MMPVPSSPPHTYRRVVSVDMTPMDPEEEELVDTMNNKPPRPIYTTRFEQGRYTSGVEAFLNDTGGSVKTGGFSSNSTSHRKTSLPVLLSSGGGLHRSRDRTRQSAVQRLVERKLAQKEKEREKERDRSWGGVGGGGVSSSSRCRYDSSFSSKLSFHSSSTSPTRHRENSCSRSENGFILGSDRSSSPWKENIEPDSIYGAFRSRRSARSVSATRLRASSCGLLEDEPANKTYITIGPGKPTRIREHSPAKSAKLTTEETVTSARERSAQSSSSSSSSSVSNSSPLRDLNRNSSPSPHRKTSRNLSPNRAAREVLRTASPLKSTNILKTFRAFKSESSFSSLPADVNTFRTDQSCTVNSNNNNNININNNNINIQHKINDENLKAGRRLSVDILNSINKNCTSSSNSSESKRASPESDRSTFSSIFSCTPLSGSTDSVASSTTNTTTEIKSPAQLAQRRISLEQRLHARARVTSPERSAEHNYSEDNTFTATSSIDEATGWTHFKFRRTSRVKTSCEFSCVTGGGGINSPHLAAGQNNHRLESGVGYQPSAPRRPSVDRPVPASRKISLPQPAGRRPEPAPRRRSLTTIQSSERLETERQAEERKEEGNQLYKLKDYREALRKYTEAIELFPTCAALYGNRSACYLMLGQPRQALEDAKTATAKDPTFTKGWSRVARCSVLFGDTISARQALDKVEGGETELRNVEVLERFNRDAQAAVSNRDYRKALYCIEKSLEVANYSSALRTSRAECLAFLGRYPEASEVANSVLQFDNLNADAIYVRGLCLYYEDNVDRAFSHFTQVLRLAPDHTKAKEIYRKAKALKQKKEEGNTAFKSGALEQAYTLYSEALDIDPFNRTTNAKLFFNRATVAAKQKKTVESIADCTKAIELDPTYIKPLLRRAKSYMETEQYEEAVRDYEAVFKTDKSNRDYRALLQEAKLELKKSKRKDYYKVLGVDKTANEEEIKKAYRKRAMVHHPDRHSGATEQEQKDHEQKFKEVGEAYAVLSDEKKRRMYDSGQDLEDGGGSGHGYHDVDPNTIFQAFFNGGGHPGMGGHHFSFGGGNPSAQSFSFQFG